MLLAATLIVVLDSIAKGVEIEQNAFGILGTEPGTIAYGAASNRDVLAAIDDMTVQSDLTPIFATRAAIVKVASFYAGLQGAMLHRALDSHYGGSLNVFLLANDLRVHPNLNLIGFQIDARNVFPPTVLDPVALYNGTGAGTGTFVAGSDINTVNYGPASMEVEVDVMGASQRNLALTMKKWDGSTEVRNVNVAANAIAGAVVAIGGAGDRYIGVTNISTTNGGGTAADRLRVRSKIERIIAL